MSLLTLRRTSTVLALALMAASCGTSTPAEPTPSPTPTPAPAPTPGPFPSPTPAHARTARSSGELAAATSSFARFLYCVRSGLGRRGSRGNSGTTGLIIGGAAGALAGRAIDKEICRN